MATPMRSWMYVPGNNPRFIEKALTEVPADVVLLDLEDGVTPAEKAHARELVRAALGRPAGGPRRWVRTNPVGSSWWEADVDAVLVEGVEGIALPKVEEPEEVHEAARHLERRSRDIAIVATIETARGLLRAPAIAEAHPRVLGLMFGAEDFALDLGLGTRREAEAQELVHARSALVIAAAADHKLAIDGVFPDLEDETGFAADLAQARRLGFKGKSTFNPRQVEPINRTFAPTQDEIAYARRVVAAFEAAETRGDGSVAVGGQLVDRPVVARAQRLLELVEEGT